MIRLVLAAVSSAMVLSACGGGGSEVSPSTVTVRETITPEAAPATPAAPAAPATPGAPVAPAAPAQSWTMPDLRGQNLQAAQDAIQRLTNDQVFFSGSTDLTGAGRNQMLDRNWQVCTSTPAPGETFSAGTSVDFGVVRIETEICP